MTINQIRRFVSLLALAALLSACGGGGGDQIDQTHVDPTPQEVIDGRKGTQPPNCSTGLCR